MTTRKRPSEQLPFLDLRIGGLHLTVQRVPYSVLALISGVGGSLGGVIWLGR
ncbi:hypothetical protein [Streptomyces sp. SID12488]|uniref:hypothetical protein n=1 Tax=Streptomyces sp. SID12488 TaxID=2706040 RepID=UPI0013DA2540|nr:hypothetical protein [Streptomyces sp. SID12488]NEA68670.1 hypothetical protein [Streptomyces sp. SID12488]